ncbi:MAG: triose-phosphate isomerase family protein, partial [Gammaproteobacteria bacterium]
MRKLLIAGNWKMNGSRESVQLLLEKININHQVDIAVFPPFVFLNHVSQQLSNTPIKWGAQNLSHELSGAFTGEISAPMLADFGCHYVLIGHSERRSLYGEDD